MVYLDLPPTRLCLVLLQIPIHIKQEVKVQLVVHLLHLPSGMVVLESRQLQHQDRREVCKESLLLHFSVKRCRLKAVVQVGVSLHLDRVRPKVRLTDEGLVVVDPFRFEVPIE